VTLIYIIDYLNKKNISPWELKPSNVMIDKNGFMKLMDFRTAKIISYFTQAIIRKPHYIAPKVLIGKGYSLTSDYWSIGIYKYEINYRSYPFGNSESEILEVYKDVLLK
jgi:cGMP-dependent protein kinase